MAIAVPLLALAILFGVFPQLIFNYVTPSVNQEIVALTQWSESNIAELTAGKSARESEKVAPRAVASEVSKTP
jgi:hypothetical protein